MKKWTVTFTRTTTEECHVVVQAKNRSEARNDGAVREWAKTHGEWEMGESDTEVSGTEPAEDDEPADVTTEATRG